MPEQGARTEPACTHIESFLPEQGLASAGKGLTAVVQLSCTEPCHADELCGYAAQLYPPAHQLAQWIWVAILGAEARVRQSLSVRVSWLVLVRGLA